MRAIRSMAVAVLAVTSAAAQVVLDDPIKIADAEKLLDTFKGDPLRCEVAPIQPRFNFSLRLQTGYVCHVPLNQPRITGHKWVVLTRVTPQHGSQHPVYLSEVVQFPSSPNTIVEAVGGASWLLGEGRYSVKWLMYDDTGYACRKEWQIAARLS